MFYLLSIYKETKNKMGRLWYRTVGETSCPEIITPQIANIESRSISPRKITYTHQLLSFPLQRL